MPWRLGKRYTISARSGGRNPAPAGGGGEGGVYQYANLATVRQESVNTGGGGGGARDASGQLGTGGQEVLAYLF